MKIDISTGELADKVSILSIKLEKISNPSKIKNIQKEYDILLKPMIACGITLDSDEFIRLKTVNLELWDIEDRIRNKEASKAFDSEFIELARSVYVTNDQRAEIKKQINLAYNSDLVEEKEYVDYKK
ncbi:MAG: hypothetical protein KFF68_01950 [Desulfosarcina sp.]|nr:hypothetical protein [Desulfosarcina sp.]